MKNKTLAKNIRYYRKEKGMTQSALAEAVFVAPQTVSKWENGISDPDCEKLCTLSDIFGVSVDSLIRSAKDDEGRAYIAVDGGGTKTDFVLFKESGEILQRFILGGCNPNAYGIEHTQKILADGIDSFLRTGAKVVGLFAGISGAAVGNNRSELTNFLKNRYPYIKIRIEGDIHNVINSVAWGDKCIAVICGTGSVVYAYNGQDLRRFGGWGYLFDDAGSGFDVGRDLFRYCLGLEDAGETDDELYKTVSEAVGGRIFDNISKIYTEGKDYIASFAPLVFDYYDKGHAAAISIIEKTVDRLAFLINQASVGGDCGNSIVIAGGLIKRKDILEKVLAQKLRYKKRIVFANQPPIYGAAVKCVKLFGGELDNELFLKNFVKAEKP